MEFGMTVQKQLGNVGNSKPNWRTPSFFRGVGNRRYTTNQLILGRNSFKQKTMWQQWRSIWSRYITWFINKKNHFSQLTYIQHGTIEFQNMKWFTGDLRPMHWCTAISFRCFTFNSTADGYARGELWETQGILLTWSFDLLPTWWAMVSTRTWILTEFLNDIYIYIIYMYIYIYV